MILDENSVAGQLMKTLFGYNGNPSLTEMIAYFGYIIVTFIFWRRDNKATVKPTVSAEAKA
jgi:high-affinity iron transporter